MGRAPVLGPILLLVVSACAGQAAQEEPPTTTASRAEPSTSAPAPTTTTTIVTATATTQPPVVWDFSPSDSPPIVTLIDAGGEPRVVREYALVAGSVAETSMRFGFSIVQVIDGVSSIDLSTDVDFELVVEVTDAVPEGFVVTSTFGDYRVSASDPAAQAALHSVYAALSGTATTQLMAPSGQVLAVAVDDQLGEFSDLTSAVASAVAPMPLEPIGIGAQWEVVSEVEVLGVTFVQTSVVTLLDVDDSMLFVEVVTTQEPGQGGLSIPGLDLTDAEATMATVGSGEAVWDLSQPIPVSAATEAVQTLEVTSLIAGEESTLDQTSTFRFELPSPAAFGPPEGTQFFVVEDRVHSEGAISYEQDPPVGGRHHPVWQNCGFYDEPVPNENAVHSLEHGAVWVTYRPDLAADEVNVLRELGQHPFTLVSPYPDLGAPVVASAWGVQLRLDSAFDPRLAEFVDWFAAGPQTPEPGGRCSGGIGSPA